MKTIGKLFLIIVVAIASSSSAKADYTQLYQRLSPTVVTIKVMEVNGTKTQVSTGSGVVIDANGLILTAAHVVHTADRIVVRLSDGSELAAELLGSNPATDLAVMKIKTPPPSLAFAQLGDSDNVQIGQATIVIGAPFGLERSLSVGVVSGSKQNSTTSAGQSLELIQTDAAINQGNSGGPMFNDKGEVIGIVSRILSRGGGFDGIGFAVSINKAKEMMAAYQENWSGFEGITLSSALAEAINVPQGSGLLVQRVHENSLAAEAGLRGGHYKAKLFGREILLGGDVILEIQNTKCDQAHDWNSIREQVQNHQDVQIEMTIMRGGKTLGLTINPSRLKTSLASDSQ